MFSTKEQLVKQQGSKGVGRFEFLKQLVQEFRASKKSEPKEQVLANLANFAYDPINYEFLRELQVVDLFLDQLEEDNVVLVRFAIGGICNMALDPESRDHMLACGAIELTSRLLASADDDTVISAMTTLIFLSTPATRTLFTSDETLSAMARFAASSDARLRNLATVFLEDHGRMPPPP